MFKIAARKSRGMQRNKDIGLFAKPSFLCFSNGPALVRSAFGARPVRHFDLAALRAF